MDRGNKKMCDQVMLTCQEAFNNYSLKTFIDNVISIYTRKDENGLKKSSLVRCLKCMVKMHYSAFQMTSFPCDIRVIKPGYMPKFNVQGKV